MTPSVGHRPTPQKIAPPPRPMKGKRRAAKFPPDDADLPGGGMPTGPSFPGGTDDPREFKKGAISPVFIGLAVLVAIGVVVLAIFAIKSHGDKMTQDQIAAVRNGIYVMPKAEQLPKWREWAKRDDVPALQQEAFANLAWAKDEEGMNTIIDKGLSSDDHRVRGTAAAALYEYGAKADRAKPILMKILPETDNIDKPQVSWALAVLKEGGAFDAVLSEYRLGHLAKIQRLDGSPAFDPDVLAGMVSLDKLAGYAGDESESVRQLTATILSRTGDAKWTDALTKLVQDKQTEVAREAAVGLGKIANEASIAPLLVALDKSDKDSRQRFLDALRDGVGANGLLLALRSIQKGHEFYQTKQIFDLLKELQDPRGGDFLVKFLDSGPLPHWRTEAALRLAEIGDLRAVEHLAWRLTQDPLKLYPKKADDDFMAFGMDDNERVISARMLADLAILNPQKKDEIRAKAEDATMGWAKEHPQPHANALRFLSVVQSPKIVNDLRKWGDPQDPLPREGQQEFPQSWATAQSALRYLGWMRDDQSWNLLLKQLNRRPLKVDATMSSLEQGGLAVLGMTLRALGVGAADGFAQWGDSKVFDDLMKYIEEPLNNEQSRYEACFALSWVATDEQLGKVVKKVHEYNKDDPKNSMIRGCFLETLIHRPVPSANAGLIDMLTASDLTVRHQAARAIGFGGVDKTIQPKLLEMLKQIEGGNDAMLALLIGADPDTAAYALAQYNNIKPELMEELKEIYDRSFGYWSDKNYENGDVARWIANAEACRYIKVRDALQDWPRMILARAIQGIDFDNGPHSITRVQFRMRLIADAKGGDQKKREDAIKILKFMKEKGVLMALRNEPAPLGELARAAFFEVMNPKMVEQKIPDAQQVTGTGGNIVPK